MSLSDRFRADLAKALKGRQAARTGVLRMLLASVKNAEIEKRGALSEDDLAAQVRRAMKLRKETIDAAVKGGRDDVRQREEAELRILEEYLPAQIHRYLFFGGLAYKHKFLVPRHSYYSVGISIGSNWIKGSHQISGSHPDITLNTLDNMGSRVAVRTYLAVEAFIWGQLMLRFQYTYMFMKSFHYQPTPNYPEKINLDFSGPALGISLFFQIPLSK